MAVNTALREARRRAHLSQDDLARRIREAGFRNGDSNGCTRGMVQRWESGKIQRPQARYLLALENVLGQPAENLGFADAAVGLDRARAEADAGMSDTMPMPDPEANYGPLTGIWLSRYTYPSSGRGADFTSSHYVVLFQRGARLAVHSVPASASRLGMDLQVNGQVITGTWTERTSEAGHYRGSVYHGAAQMLLAPTENRMVGKWVGFGRDMDVNVGPWSLERVESSVDAEAIERWNRPGEDS